jgi:hypothetical protein
MAKPHLNAEPFQLRFLSAGDVEANLLGAVFKALCRRALAARGVARSAVRYMMSISGGKE